MGKDKREWYAVAVSISKQSHGWTFEYGVLLEVLPATSAEEAKGAAVARILQDRKGWQVGGVLASRVPPV